MGLVRSVKVVAVPGGVSAPLSAEGGAGSEVPSALSTPPFSCRKRFLLNLALAFWNQTCKPIPIDFFTDACFFFCLFLSLFLLSHFLDVCFWVANHLSHSTASLATGSTDPFTGGTPEHKAQRYRRSLEHCSPACRPRWAALRKICSLTHPRKATFLMAIWCILGLGRLGVKLYDKDWGKGWMSRFLPRLKVCLDYSKRLKRKEG